MSLVLDNIWFKYSIDSKWVLKNITHEVREGRVEVVLGPNGSGKTTLLKIMGLIYKPLKGRVIVWGHDFWRLKSFTAIELRRRIVYVHEKPILLKGTVFYNISYGLILRNYSFTEIKKIVDSVLKEYNLLYLRDKDSRSLSAGEAQIVSILRAIVLNPDILLLDEPLAHLDIDKRKIVVEAIKSLRKNGGGIVIATHDMYLVEKLAEEVYMMKNGGLVRISKEELAKLL